MTTRPGLTDMHDVADYPGKSGHVLEARVGEGGGCRATPTHTLTVCYIPAVVPRPLAKAATYILRDYVGATA